MFNALNRFISRLDGESPQQAAARQAALFGFQVLRNSTPELPIEPWFDFIVGINYRSIDNPDPHLFAQEVRNCAGGMVVFTLWNAKGERTRDLHVSVPPDTASLGLALQWTPLAVAANIWHVLDVAANSPADLGGLLPYGDYILGSPDGVLHGESGLSELVEAHLGMPLRLFVYNNEYNVVRIVTIQPARDWGGDGILGCVLGYGALHRIPPPLSEPATAPGETLFDGSPDNDGMRTPVANADGFVPVSGASPSSTVFTPATVTSLPPPPPPPMGEVQPLPARKKKERLAHGNKAFMDDYFKEEEMKSREADNAPSRGATPVAPPPKVGVAPPPKATPAPAPAPAAAAAAGTESSPVTEEAAVPAEAVEATE
ncbi:hypothetical protein TD95_001868 [Thielaviopsis punctulata]|uniref:PDZ GRASP-type domain-containing protein n=1 Tax=Thielaviopsis punctulata TaxID=72032 RepID=A0A0F4ZFJ3_9PEZI|nr:hypothetical protein TD95_001868 [Thielaviopsis punctulata]